MECEAGCRVSELKQRSLLSFSALFSESEPSFSPIPPDYHDREEARRTKTQQQQHEHDRQWQQVVIRDEE
jgi:hypothetical protein